MKICVIIPARYQSSRFEGKPLADINGRPMIWWVYNSVKKSKKIDKVIIAIDDERIAKVCDQYKLPYVYTSSDHQTSTQRVHEVATKEVFDYYICVNGDEPLIDYRVIESIIPEEIQSTKLYVSNLMTKIINPAEVIDGSNIKVAFNSNMEAIFMSRSPIPYPKSSLEYNYYKHVGVLCYNKLALDYFSNTPKGSLEKIEDINELRFLENSIPINMKDVETKVLSVDTPKDLEYIKNYLIEKNISYENI